jgi:hypothetical protein
MTVNSLALFLALASAVLAGCRRETPPTASGSASSRASAQQRLYTVRASDPTGQKMDLLVDQGDAEEAKQYYAQLAVDLGIPPDGNLDSLIQFVGYDNITARQLELWTPTDVKRSLGDDAEMVRFFAPKIVDVSKPDGDLGWRSVVRLRVKPNSPAAAKKLDSLFLLFNVFQLRGDVGNDPFEPCVKNVERCSQNNQVILTVSEPAAGGPTAYWLVFETASVAGGKRTDHLNATFDGGDQASEEAGSAVKPYFVPAACAQCHGGSEATAKINALDSDHWNDRIQPGDDFAEIKAAGKGVLVDGGTDPSTDAFKEVFAALTRINVEARDQIAKADGDDFHLRAVKGWLNLHKTSIDFAPPIARALPPVNASDRVWTNTQSDVRLLTLLNQYCYRCHSNVAYHVFDKQAVFVRRNNMIRRIKSGPQNPGGMPQDRRLPAPVAEELIKLLSGMQ